MDFAWANGSKGNSFGSRQRRVRKGPRTLPRAPYNPSNGQWRFGTAGPMQMYGWLRTTGFMVSRDLLHHTILGRNMERPVKDRPERAAMAGSLNPSRVEDGGALGAGAAPTGCASLLIAA